MLIRHHCRQPWRILVLYVSLGGSPTAWAEGAPSSRPSALEAQARARALFDEAETQYRLGKFERALEGYKAALKLWRHPALVFNIAQCHRQRGELQHALFFYRLFLSDWEREYPATMPPNRQEVQAQIDWIVEHLRPKAAATPTQPTAHSVPTTLRFTGPTPTGARVVVDGANTAVLPLAAPLVLPAGTHRIEIRSPGHHIWKRTIDLVGGRENTLPIKLTPLLRRSRFWLASAITGGVLAAGAEAAAIVFYVRAQEHFRGTPPFEEERRLAIGGHVAAGVLAALTATSIVMYLRSGRVEGLAQALLVPWDDGLVAGACLQF